MNVIEQSPVIMQDSVCVISTSPARAKALKQRINLRNETITSVALEQAPVFLQEHRPVVVVLDVGMSIKTLKPILNQAACIVLAETYDEDFFVNCYDLGARDVLAQPVPDVMLMARVVRTLENQQHLHQIRQQTALLKELGVVSPRSGVYSTPHMLRLLQQHTDVQLLHPERCLSLVMLEMSGYPHPLANELARMIYTKTAERIAQVARGLDLVGEYMEDKFMILLPGTPISGARALSKRLKVRLDGQQFKYRNQMHTLQVRLGAAEYKNGQTYEILIHHALNALEKS